MSFVFILFIVIPLLEIYLFIQLGGLLGGLNTLALVILTAAVGIILLRWQGVQALRRARERMATGQAPEQQMLDGLLLGVGAVLLVLPGFFTDSIGLLLLIPILRRALGRWLMARAVIKMSVHQQYQSQQRGTTIEGDYRREDKQDPPLPPR